MVNRTLMLKLMAVLMAVSFLILTAPVQAQVFKDLWSNITTPFSTNDLRFKSQLDDIEDRITIGLEAGYLSVMDAAALRKKLNDLVLTEDEYRHSGGGINFMESMALSKRVESINSKLDKIVTSKLNYSDEFEKRIKMLNLRISRAFTEGKINSSTAVQLGEELTSLSQLRNELKEDDSITPYEHSFLSGAIDDIRARLEEKIALSSPKKLSVKGQVFKLYKMINVAVRQGKLGQEEERLLKERLVRLERLALRFKKSGGVYSAWEMNYLKNEFASLARSIKIHTGESDVAYRELDNRIHRLRERIKSGAKAGMITTKEESRLNEELLHTTASKVNLEKSGGGMTESEAEHIRADLDRLNDLLDQSLWNRSVRHLKGLHSM